MEVRVCPGCDRDFLPSTCEFHCGPVCCRKMKCRNAKPHQESQRKSMQAQRRCVVCGAHGDWFEKFAPCVRIPVGSPPGTLGCKRNRYWVGYGMQYICWEHHPNRPERIHVKYCSLKCYNNWDSGHRVKVAAKERRKWTNRGKQQRNYRKALQEAGGKLY
jgi:hypothetical protein